MIPALSLAWLAGLMALRLRKAGQGGDGTQAGCDIRRYRSRNRTGTTAQR